MVLRYSWHACERARAQSGRKTRFSASASVWNQLQAAQSPQSSTRPMAPTAALGGAWCSGARGSRVSVCCALRASARLDSVHSRVSGTSRSRHSPRNRAPGRWRQRRRSGALGGARCSGARGSRVSVCGALRDSTQCICERLEPAEIATDSAIEHPGDGATGGARGPQLLRCSCTLASVLLATGVELSTRMCEHLELIGAAALGKIASCRQFPPFRFVLVKVLCCTYR